MTDPPLERATMVFSVRAWADGDTRIVARDSSTGASWNMPATSTWTDPLGNRIEVMPELYALSPDGTRLLVERPTFHGGRLLLVRFGGPTVELSEGPYDDWHRVHVASAAFSPDGSEIATLTAVGDSEPMRVRIIDVDSGQFREIWSAEGHADSITWSPDGRFLGVTYIDPAENPDDLYHSVVLDTAGAVVADHPETVICGRSRLSWHGDHELLMISDSWSDEVPPLVLVDPVTGNRREVRQPSSGDVIGVVGGRLLLRVSGSDGIGTHVVVATDDGSDPRILLGPMPRQDISLLDATPGLLDTL